jgi:hypothetical protein
MGRAEDCYATGIWRLLVSGQHGQSELIRFDGLGVNIVAVVQSVEGEHIWIKANGAGDVPVGWVNKKNAILLDDAIPYFTSLIERNPKDWDAYLRRGESKHALNQRETAIADYTGQSNCIQTSRFCSYAEAELSER